MRLAILFLLAVGCSINVTQPRVISLSPLGERCYHEAPAIKIVGDSYVSGPLVTYEFRGDLTFVCSSETGFRWRLSLIHPFTGFGGGGAKEIKIQ